MSLLVLPPEVEHLSIALPQDVQAAPTSAGQRAVYFEAANDAYVDREGEVVSTDALWDSRNLLKEQGSLDIWHFSFLKQDPSYIIGNPIDVKRDGSAIYVLGEIFNPTSDEARAPYTSGWWANLFWHSLTALRPPMRWFPSVLGSAKGAEVEIRKGQRVKVFRGPVEWYSVGFAPRVQNPGLPAISTTPIGPFQEVVAKAVMPASGVKVVGKVAAMSLATFAKAVASTAAVSGLEGKAKLKGLSALRRESLEGAPLRNLYRRHKKRVLGRILRREIPGDLGDVTDAFAKCGMSKAEAAQCAKWLGEELHQLLR